MLSEKDGQMSFSNGPLRDQWEKKAQLVDDECKQEAEWKKKSSIKISNSKWNYHWSLVFNGDLKRLTSGTDEEEKKKSKIKFKIVPPPPKPKHEPAPPPPPPRKTAVPKHLREKRKVEVDVFGLCWRDSWMSLKPPKYLYLRDKETKPRIPVFTTIELSNNKKYKPKENGSDTEGVLSADEWNHSWKQVRSPAQLERSVEKPFQWEILLKRKLIYKAEVELYYLPVWAGTWKNMTFAFRQRKKNWDCIWPVYQLNLSKFDRMQLKEQEGPSDWEDSWKLSGAEHKRKDTTDDETQTASSSSTETTAKMKIIKVFLPGWNNSWLLSAVHLKEEEHHKDWDSCWGYRQQIRWCKASLESHFQHSAMLTRGRKATNLLLTSHLYDAVINGTEWMEAWRTPKRWFKLEDYELDKGIQEENKVLVERRMKARKKMKIKDKNEEDEVDNGEEEGKEEDEEEKDNVEDKGKQQEETDIKYKNTQEERDKNMNKMCGPDEDEEDNESHDEDTDIEEKDKMCKVSEEDDENEAQNDQDKDVNSDREEEDVDVETGEDVSEAEEMVKNNVKDDHEDKDEKEDKVKKEIKPDVPLHLQFHKLNTSFPSWKKSWIVAVAYRGGDEGQGEEEDDGWWRWKESWRICKRNKPDKDEVVCFSEQRFMGLKDGEEQMPKIDWNLSWKINKTAKEEEV